MKKVGIVLLTICVIALLIVTGFLYGRLKNRENEIASKQQEIDAMESQLLGGQTKENEKNSKVNYTFDEDKMKVEEEDYFYEGIYYDSLEGITIYTEGNTIELSTTPANDNYKMLYPKVKKEISNQELTGFEGKIASVYFAYFGNDLVPSKILFLMEDGTVEYMDSEEVVKDKNYESKGKIEGLENIVRFERVAVGLEDEDGERDGGTVTVVAIDQDGNGYDLEKLMREVDEEDAEFKEGTYTNSDDPEVHSLTFENGKVTYETLDKYVGTYEVEGDKVKITYTKAYGPDGEELELPVDEETYIIGEGTLTQDDEHKMVYELQ